MFLKALAAFVLWAMYSFSSILKVKTVSMTEMLIPRTKLYGVTAEETPEVTKLFHFPLIFRVLSTTRLFSSKAERKISELSFTIVTPSTFVTVFWGGGV